MIRALCRWCGSIIIGLSAFSGCPAPDSVDQGTPIATERWNVPVKAADPSWGPEDALVTIVVFEDLQCPFSKHLQPHLRALRQRFPTDVRVVFRALPLPFHAAASDLAIAAFCAHEQGRFLPFHDRIFESPTVPLGDPLERLAESLEIALPAFRQCLDSPRPIAGLKRDAALARQVRVGGTPTFFINGRKVTGEYPLEGLFRLVEEEIEAATVLADTVGRGPRLYLRLLEGSKSHHPLAPDPVALPDTGAPRRGHVGAPWEIAVWLDFSSGFQTRLAGALMRIQAERSPQEDLSLVLQPFAPPEDSLGATAARMASCAMEQGRFWAFLEQLSVNVASRQQAPQTRELLWEAAKTAQIDPAHLEICLNDPVREANDLSRWAKAQELRFQRTPCLYINGRRYDGSLGWGPRALARLFLIAKDAI